MSEHGKVYRTGELLDSEGEPSQGRGTDNSSAVNTVLFMPLVVDVDLPVDGLWHDRGNGATGTVDMALYDFGFSRIAEANRKTGTADFEHGHVEPLGNSVTLTAYETYYLALRQTAQIVVYTNRPDWIARPQHNDAFKTLSQYRSDTCLARDGSGFTSWPTSYPTSSMSGWDAQTVYLTAGIRVGAL